MKNDHLKGKFQLIPYHNASVNFDYDLVIDWALKLMKQGIESEDIVILASCTKPADSRTLTPYLDNVLKELGLAVKSKEEAIAGFIQYHVQRILTKQPELVEDSLTHLNKLHLQLDESFDYNDKYRTRIFALLYNSAEAYIESRYGGVVPRTPEYSDLINRAVEEAQNWMK